LKIANLDLGKGASMTGSMVLKALRDFLENEDECGAAVVAAARRFTKLESGKTAEDDDEGGALLLAVEELFKAERFWARKARSKSTELCKRWYRSSFDSAVTSSSE